MSEIVNSRGLRGHDFGAPNTDPLAVFYSVLAIFWTLFVGLGLFWMYRARHFTGIRIRNIAVIYSAVLCIHAYLMLILMAYPLNGRYKCGAEFWVMSVFLPFGMALFQASNIRLLSYYEAQQSITERKGLLSKRRRLIWSVQGLKKWWPKQDLATKTYVGIGIGLVVQLLLTFILFMGSRRYHSSFGFYAEPVSPAKCRQGFDWVPSVFWQFLWTWVFGPVLLLKIRHINDEHNWAWQTKVAILAGLPGTPLWLAFTYANTHDIRSINRFFIPPGWFIPGLVTLQFISVFYPLLGVYRTRYATINVKLDDHDSEKQETFESSPSRKNRDCSSMASLESQIERNIDPLLQWAATKEFTAENVVFLREVRNFKRKWEMAAKRSGETMDHRHLYEEAGLIFFTLVNPDTAKFNINIDSRTYNELSQMFTNLQFEPFEDDATSVKSGKSSTNNNATPWEDFDMPGASQSANKSSDVDKLYPLPVVTEISPSEAGSYASSTTASGGSGEMSVTVPPSFNVKIFDRAYDIVKRDVFLNTWMKYYESRVEEPDVRNAPEPLPKSMFSRLTTGQVSIGKKLRKKRTDV